MTNIARLTPKQSGQLADLVVTINAEFQHASSLAKQAVEKYIQIGTHLNEARAMFPGDREFGQWAQEHLPDIQKRWRSSLMAVARKFAPILEQTDSSGQPAARNLLTLLPVSTLNELVPASDETIDKVVARLRSGATVTKVEAREMVRETPKIPTGGDGSATTPLVAPTPTRPTDTRVVDAPVDAEPVVTVESIQARTMALVTMSVDERLKYSSDPFVIFGINPFMDDILINEEMLEVTYNLLFEACKKDSSQCEKITTAYDVLKDQSQLTAQSYDLGLVAHKIREGYYD